MYRLKQLTKQLVLYPFLCRYTSCSAYVVGNWISWSISVIQVPIQIPISENRYLRIRMKICRKKLHNSSKVLGLIGSGFFRFWLEWFSGWVGVGSLPSNFQKTIKVVIIGMGAKNWEISLDFFHFNTIFVMWGRQEASHSKKFHLAFQIIRQICKKKAERKGRPRKVLGYFAFRNSSTANSITSAEK